jgi:hypothetical protein
MNKKYLVAAVGAALAVAGVSAHAIEAKLSGQVARGIMFADDGKNSEMHHVDAADKTRFRFTGSADLMEGVKGGIIFETEFVSNGSSAVSNARAADLPTGKSTTPALSERIMAVYIDGSFGRVTSGQHAGAADGNTETDLSGTGIFASMTIADWGGSMRFCDSNDVATVTCTGPTVSQVINNRDFESRYDLLRYDTPALGPVKLAVSTGTKNNLDSNEVGARFGTDMGGGGKLEGAVGYSVVDKAGTAGADRKTTGGSVAWLAPFGLNVAVGVSKVKDGSTSEDEWTYLKVGYKTGMHAVSVELSQGNDQATNGDEAQMMGLAYVYKPKSWAELFAGYRLYSLDRANVTFEDLSLLAAGVYLKF